MKAKPKVMEDGCRVTVRVPISIRRRWWPQACVGTSGVASTAAPIHRRIDTAIVKAVARAFRWREMLENGEYSTIREIAGVEKINETYVGRVLRLTLLAPEIIEAILNGLQPAGLQLDVSMKPFPIEWEAQSEAFMPY